MTRARLLRRVVEHHDLHQWAFCGQPNDVSRTDHVRFLGDFPQEHCGLGGLDQPISIDRTKDGVFRLNGRAFDANCARWIATQRNQFIFELNWIATGES